MPTMTQQRIRIESPFPITELTAFRVRQSENEHARAEFQGVLDEETGMDALFGRLEGQLVRFIDEQSGNPVFAGYIDTVEVTVELGLLTLSAVALSASKMLDYVKRSRSYQDVTMTYEDVLRLALDDVETSDFIMRVDDKPIGIPLIQYAETGWEFAMRMASHFNTTLTPEMESGLPRFWVGLRAATGELYDFTGCDYRVKIEKKYYEAGGEQLGFSRAQFTSYTVNSYEDCRIGSKAIFKGQMLRICRKACAFENGLLTYEYTLGYPELLAWRKFYNEKLTGLSLLGEVIATQGGTVKLKLNIDEGRDAGPAYPYRWAPPTGNLLYLMPKIGSVVSLYFSDPDEGGAKAVNCVRAEVSRSSPGMADPNKRGLSSEFGKVMLLHPDRFGFESETGDGPLRFMFSDDEGVTLETKHGITVIGGGAVTLEAPVIEMSSPTQVGFYYTAGRDLAGGRSPPTGLTVHRGGIECISEHGRSGMTGQESWELPAFADDVPEEGQFDWGGLFGNILAGLAVVGAVVLVAATFGATAPVLIAGAVAGAAAVGAKAASDIARGNVSSAGDYMREAFISTTVGLVTGAIGNGISGLKAMQTLGKVGKAMANIGVDMLQGAAGSATHQLMRASVYGQDIDWGYFWQDVGIGTVAGAASGVIGRGIGGNLNRLAGGLLQNNNPGMNTAITAAIAGAGGGGTNFAMQLGNMALFDENGNLDLDLSRVSLDNVDLNSVTNSVIVGMAQSAANS
ncbi:MAG: hypothetical protein LBD49_01065, partial [Oscillospiraceae bacterium]|nr:hypothetical protein [Oscillospiraceae bacterium]